MVKISIITVTFNRAHVIRDAIEGVLRQKYKNYEYIIIDGASKDNTLDILKEYEPKFEGRMRWISEPDKGLYDAINKGIRMATGDVVGIINSDDFFHRDDTFDVIAEAFEDDTIQAIHGNDRTVKADDLEHNYRYCAPWYFKPWMYRFGLEPSHPTFYARRNLFEKYGYYKIDYIVSADLELMMRFMLINKIKTKYIDHTFLTFRLGGVSTSASNRLMMNKEIVRACKENGIWTCLPFVYMKYFVRLTEMWFGKNRR